MFISDLTALSTVNCPLAYPHVSIENVYWTLSPVGSGRENHSLRITWQNREFFCIHEPVTSFVTIIEPPGVTIYTKVLPNYLKRKSNHLYVFLHNVNYDVETSTHLNKGEGSRCLQAVQAVTVVSFLAPSNPAKLQEVANAFQLQKDLFPFEETHWEFQ